MAEQKRADYASTRPQATGAWVAAVEEGGPAWEAGIEPGMRVVSARDAGLEAFEAVFFLPRVACPFSCRAQGRKSFFSCPPLPFVTMCPCFRGIFQALSRAGRR